MDSLKIHPLLFQQEKGTSIIASVGGPAGGKSSVLAPAAQKLQDMGIVVGIQPELATEYRLRGFEPGTTMTNRQFQEAILLGTVEREYRYYQMLKCIRAPQQRVLLTDRGRLDGCAYIDPEEFFAMAKSYGYEPADLGEKIYKAVIHMVSVAVDAKDLYTCENNPARCENDYQLAVELDRRVLKAYAAHPHRRVIANIDADGNRINMEQKTNLFVREVAHALGVPEPLEIERKFRVYGMPKLPPSYDGDVVAIGQWYQENPNGYEERLRKRTWRGSSVYYHAIKRKVSDGVREENERMIYYPEYRDLLLNQNKPGTRVVTKNRHCFVHKNQYFELDEYTDFYEGLVVLEIELTDRNDRVSIPDWMGRCCEVTGEARYSNASLAEATDKFWLND
jgi:CYTH domain-containing protein